MQHLRILIADTDSSITNLLSKILKLWNHSCYVCFQLDHTLELIEQSDFDIIFIHSSMINVPIEHFENKIKRRKFHMLNRLCYTTESKTDLLKSHVKEERILEIPFKISSVRTALQLAKVV